MFSSQLAWIRAHSDQIFSWFGRVALTILGFYLLWLLLSFIWNLPGFRFDPFGLIVLIIIGFQLNRWITNQNLVVERQNALLAELMLELRQKNEESEAIKNSETIEKKAPLALPDSSAKPTRKSRSR